MSEKSVLAILGSPHQNGVTATMLNYSIREAEKAGYTVKKSTFMRRNLIFVWDVECA